jgi:hypothetical protein
MPEKNDRKQVSCSEPKNIRRHPTECSRMGDPAAEVCAPLKII